MRRILEREFTVGVPLHRAWDHLAAIENWPSWAGHIRSVEKQPDGPLCAETTGTIRLTNGFASTFVMTELNPPRSWKWVGPFLGCRIHYDHVLAEIDEHQTRITFVLDAEGWSVPIVAGLFARVYRKNLERAIPNLIAEMENAHSAV
jgi:carbon monoxide dehydrogenase subunit G